MQLFDPNRSYLSYLFLQVGKRKVTARLGLKILWIHCQNSALIMTNGIRKVRLGVDIFNKRILDSCKFISDSASEYSLIYGNLFLAASKREGKEKRNPPPLHYYFFSFS